MFLAGGFMSSVIFNDARRWAVGLILLAALGVVLAGCGPTVTFCATGESCSSSTSGCSPACSSGQVCVSGQCITQSLQCSQAGDQCDPAASTNAGYLCIDWDASGVQDPMCSKTCAADGSCPAGSSCFVLRSNFDRSCHSESDCADQMHCIQGTCRFTACEPSECAGFVSGQRACQQKYADSPSFPDGAKCYEFPNNANFCMPAGTRQLGEQCTSIEDAMQAQSFQATCAVGLGCVNGRCSKPCSADDDCDSGQSCVVGEPTDLGDGVGFCADPCTPFQSGSCGDRQTCEPVSADTGNCVPAGAKPAFSRCTPGAGECVSGTLCIPYPSANGGSEGRCHPICDLSAAPPAEDGTVSAGAQAARDATCPQPEAAPASVRAVHMVETLGPVDVYVGDSDTPLASGLDFEGAAPTLADGGWAQMEPGRYRVVVLPQGAPRTDRPLARGSIELSSGKGTVVYIAPPAPTSSDDAQLAVVAAPAADARTQDTDVSVVHLLSDADAVDVVAVAAGADATATSNQVVLAEGLGFGQASAPVAVSASPMRVLVFAAGADRSDPSSALLDLAGVSADADSSLVLRGTLDPDDFFDAGVPSVLELGDPAQSMPRGPQYSCTALAGKTYGYCQQICVHGADDFGQDACQGDGMGCVATDFPKRSQWLSLCAPVGDGGTHTPCDPTRPYGTCKEGYYCQQYGTGAMGETGGLLGECSPLCAVDAGGTSSLGCDDGQSCEPVVYDGSYDIGHCGWACDPGDRYADQSCPDGLQSCKPHAALLSDASGQSAPVVEHEQPFCSASGPVQAGQPCGGRDCVAGTECLYPRSQQTDLVSTLLSPYFGAAGQVPTCKPQCDPFDGDSSAYQCANGETCLPNYPFSAEVGHCAPIVEDIAPMQPCIKPGLSCGEDSICVVYQGSQTCFRFCDYLGADAQGAYLQSTCPANLVCTPFVKDIGVCQAPQ